MIGSNLLKVVEINSIDDILNDDAFGLLRDDKDDIFKLKHVPNNFSSERSKADKVGMPEKFVKILKNLNIY